MHSRGTPPEHETARKQMVARQLRPRGIRDHRVLEAMATIPRHRFVPKSHQHAAYEDGPLPIGDGQTISQPYIVARMTAALSLAGGCRVLEIGTGSGYQTAILAHLAERVWTVERSPVLHKRARSIVTSLGYGNVQFVLGDGTVGLPRCGPFDRIIATGSLPSVPDRLLEQLVPTGVFVGPVGSRFEQRLVRMSYDGNTEAWTQELLCWCRFVPLVGRNGWAEG